MDVLLQGLGSIGFFASRAFLPAFVSALILRLGPHVPWLADTDLVRAVAGAPGWFTAWPTIALLGLLAAAEIAAGKSTDARALLDRFEHWLKPALAVLTYLGIASVGDVEFVERTIKKAGFADWLPALAIGGGTYWLGALRNELMELLTDADEDDDAGVQGLISWAEDLWSLAGPVLLVLFPLVMLALVGGTACVLYLLRKRAEKKEEANKVACASCGTSTYRCALCCARCGAAVAAPADIGFFGTSLERPARDRGAHAYRLAEKKRCPACATRLEERAPRQRCPACARELHSDPAFTEAYLAVVRARLPQVLAVCAVCSLVPIAGLLPGVIYYRLALVAPFRRYIPRGRSLAMKWSLRVVFMLLAAIQWIPAVGGVVVPIMALVNYAAWRGLFLSTLREAGAAPSPAVA